MSHQGHEGWFPECLVCGMGNLGGIVCVTPDVWDRHGTAPVVGDMSGNSILTKEADGHWWKRCLLCEAKVLADSAAWGSVAYCVGCWNHFTTRDLYPPASAIAARRMSEAEWGGGPRRQLP